MAGQTGALPADALISGLVFLRDVHGEGLGLYCRLNTLLS
jgi:hypothetical protein